MKDLLYIMARIGLILVYISLGMLIGTLHPQLPPYSYSGMLIGITMGIPYFTHWLRIRKDEE